MVRRLIVLIAAAAFFLSVIAEAYPANAGPLDFAAGSRSSCPHAGVCPLKKAKEGRVHGMAHEGRSGAQKKDRDGCAVIECHRQGKSAASFPMNDVPFIASGAVEFHDTGHSMPAQAALPGLYKGPDPSRPDRPPSIPRQT